ncbi:AfsA-related hotdog domain-containing protein [Kitasatospora sp. HPMI-4]|uniref:AfsA-related hotdog domain-containing protein n=1 Tax=Kitasatospora sp. HPMI-4 TaxID=3448443 RepID=UPI003F1DED56
MPEIASPTLIVVGDRFGAFADQTSSVTVSGLIERLRAGAHSETTGPGALSLLEGQGVTAYDWDRIRYELKRCGLDGDTVIHRGSRGRLGDHTETHKHRESNVLLAGLTRSSDRTFHAALRLHNDNELQLDHQASHVQGMVVLEAARQMYVAVCERYYTYRWPEHRYGHVFDRLETSFRNFLFPVEASIECEVLRVDLSDPQQLAFDLEVALVQARLRCATVRMVGTALPAPLLERKERRGAERAVRHAATRIAAPPELAAVE